MSAEINDQPPNNGGNNTPNRQKWFPIYYL